MRIEAVFFDVGETLVDESRIFAGWADWLGVPRLTFAAVLGAVLARGSSVPEVFDYFRPGIDLEYEAQRRVAAGESEGFGEPDLYPDVRACLAALRAQGLFVGIAGNQPVRAERDLAALALPADLVATSQGWGVEKPDPTFFERVAVAAGCPVDAVLYVGDRLDNDARPAQEVGMPVAHLRRGPWGHLIGDLAARERCMFLLDSLVELPDVLAKHNAAV